MTAVYIIVGFFALIGAIAMVRKLYAGRNDGSAFGNGGLDSRYLNGSIDPRRRKDD